MSDLNFASSQSLAVPGLLPCAGASASAGSLGLLMSPYCTCRSHARVSGAHLQQSVLHNATTGCFCIEDAAGIHRTATPPQERTHATKACNGANDSRNCQEKQQAAYVFLDLVRLSGLKALGIGSLLLACGYKSAEIRAPSDSSHRCYECSDYSTDFKDACIPADSETQQGADAFHVYQYQQQALKTAVAGWCRAGC